MITAPVVLIIFRRPDLTARVLSAIAKVKPRTLLVAADGPRFGRADDVEACAAARAVIDRVDWDCEVIKHYSDVNLGCGRGPAAGISWALEQVERAIILEDDCVPDPSFFRFCEEMLERYADDERVMHIAGSTFLRRPIPTRFSYVFSQFNSGWGWATWRRAWRHFDASVKLWPELRQTSWLADVLDDDRSQEYWGRQFSTACDRDGDVSYWDYQWTFACWAHSGLTITPRVNLVSNIGCGPDATHTLWVEDPMANVPASELVFPLVHPPNVLQMKQWDREFLRDVILARVTQPSTLRRLASRLAPEIVKQGYRQLASVVRSTSGQLLS